MPRASLHGNLPPNYHSSSRVIASRESVARSEPGLHNLSRAAGISALRL